MTVTQTGRRMAFTGLLALAASLLPLSAANAQLTADDTAYVVGDTNTEASIKHSRLTYTPLSGDVDAPATEVLIGTADTFADNLAAGTLSGQALDGGRPLYLNDSDDSVSQDILDEIARVTNGAADVTAHILGGTAAQGEGVADDLEAAGYTVNRFSGATRTETAIDIAEATDNTTVMVVRAFAAADSNDATQAFADSLTAGAVAATLGYDIVFTQTEVLTGSTAAYLAEAGYESAIIVGGTAAISEATEAEVAALIEDTTRVSGATRFDTQIALNELRETPVGPFAIVVDGQEDDAWANAFAAANWSGLANAPVVLTNQGELPQQTEDYLVAQHESTFAAHGAANFAFCGTNVTPELCQEIADLQGGTTSEFDAPAPDGPTPNETGLTDRPELATATVGALVTPAQASAATPAGLRVSYAFDEPIATVTAAGFEVHAADGTEYTGGTATVDSTDNSVVTVNFTSITSQTVVDTLTVATNMRTAAIDFQGLNAAQGDYGIGSDASTGAGAAGVTNRPDLLSIQNFRPSATTTQTAVDFVFDENTWSTADTNGNFVLVPSDGTTANVDCLGPLTADTTTSGGTVAGGNGTTTLTVLCDNATAGTYRTAASFARGYAVTGAVTDAAAGGNANTFPTVAAVTGGTTFTTDPDITTGSFALDISSGTTNYDGAVFSFDNPIASTAGGAAFHAYDANGAVLNGLATPAPQVSGTQVLVYFTDGTLANAVGIYADANAVTTTGTALTNEIDEIGVENSATSDRVPGSTTDPELTNLTVALSTPTIGAASNQAVYTFDEDVVLGAVTGFYLYLADGTALIADACSVGITEDTDNVVTCTGFDNGAVQATSAEIGAAVRGGVDDTAVTAQTGGAANTVGGEVVA